MVDMGSHDAQSAGEKKKKKTQNLHQTFTQLFNHLLHSQAGISGGKKHYHNLQELQSINVENLIYYHKKLDNE